MVSDTEWQAWGEKDPYFGVLTEERYRKRKLTAEALEEFFRTGRRHIEEILAACRRHFGDISTQRSLDFGCGVGRTLIPLSEVSEVCVGVDIAGAMLQEAARNCLKYNRHNVRLARTLQPRRAAARLTPGAFHKPSADAHPPPHHQRQSTAADEPVRHEPDAVPG